MSRKVPEGWKVLNRPPAQPAFPAREIPGVGVVTEEEYMIFEIGRMRGILEARGLDPDDPELRGRLLVGHVYDLHADDD